MPYYAVDLTQVSVANILGKKRLPAARCKLFITLFSERFLVLHKRLKTCTTLLVKSHNRWSYTVVVPLAGLNCHSVQDMAPNLSSRVLWTPRGPKNKGLDCRDVSYHDSHR